MFVKLFKFIIFINFAATFKTFKNDLALSPPMGWMAWGKFMCETDCQKHPTSCINEKLFMDMADMMVEKGFKDAGYAYVCVDDCWASKLRDSNHKLSHDSLRFPSGMTSLSDYIHSKGLKFGLYLSYGKHTCMGKTPGSLEYMEIDARTMAEWGVDYIKVDGCFTNPKIMDVGYPMIGYFLNKTGQPMVYSCSWPFYQEINNIKPDYRYVKKHCHLWRNYVDIFPNWSSIKDIISHYAAQAPYYAKNHGPNGWTDPDQLLIGNGGITLAQAKSHMAIWAMLAAPLMMSNDLRTIDNASIAILTNRQLIAINQDPLGAMGTVVWQNKDVMVWRKVLAQPDTFTIAFYNPSDSKTWRSETLNLTLSLVGCSCTSSSLSQNVNCYFDLYDLFDNNPNPKDSLNIFKSGINVHRALDWLEVEPSGVIVYKVIRHT